MIWVDFIFVFLIAIIIAGILATMGGNGYGEGWIGLLWLFGIIFLVTWAVGGWSRPIGPPLWGAYWLPFLIVAIFVGLLFAAISEPRPRWRRRGAPLRATPPTNEPPPTISESEAADEEAAIGCGIFFWILVVIAIISIAFRYAW